MDQTNYLVLVLIGLAVLSLFAFIVVSVLAWSDNVLLFKHYQEQAPKWLVEAAENLRALYNSEFRHWRNTIKRYANLVSAIRTASDSELQMVRMAQLAKTSSERDFLQGEAWKYRTIKNILAPAVVKELIKFTDDDLRIVAQELAGFTFDNPASQKDWAESVRLNQFLVALREQKKVIEADPTRLLVQLDLLG